MIQSRESSSAHSAWESAKLLLVQKAVKKEKKEKPVTVHERGYHSTEVFLNRAMLKPHELHIVPLIISCGKRRGANFTVRRFTLTLH